MIDLFGNIENSGADFSECRNYRYALWRIWDKSKPMIMFIGLNPSIANATQDDPTIRRVKRFAKDWGYGGVYMMNCFAYVSTKPELIKHNPMADEWNNNMLTINASKCKSVLFAWGNFEIIKETGRDKELSEMFPNAVCLGKNKNGSPKHPFYVAANTSQINYK